MKAEAQAMTCKQARELLSTGVHALVFWRPSGNLDLRHAENDLAMVTVFEERKDS